MINIEVIHEREDDWVNGIEAAAGFTQEFRDNLGPAEDLPAMLGKYWVRNLYYDAGTTTRIDHIRNDPGYADLTFSYHRSAEESLLLRGEMLFDPEGPFEAGDYFWRPPGFVHTAVRSDGGAEALLIMVGTNPEERSGRGDRTVTPPGQAGENVLHPDDWATAIGPRGWIQHRRSRYEPWRPSNGSPPVLGRGALHKTLSRNVVAGSSSTLHRLPEESEAVLQAGPRQMFVFLWEGSAESELGLLEAGSAIHAPPGSRLPVRTSTDCRLFVKS